ncbi:MAG: hypothetical protein GX096_00755 [Clostridiales bacterium]|nr:hypothetical protein [Clostridiales bacterium]
MLKFTDRFTSLGNNNSKRNAFVALLALLSVFVTMLAFALVIQPAATLSAEPICGIEEHIHGDVCYEHKTICGLDEANNHTHDSACDEDKEILVCNQQI